MPEKKLLDLPIGLQDFQKLKEGNFLYVDKTRYIYDLLNSAGVYFLSRPRRFGKSLLLSTIRAIFEGKRELVKGLYIDSSDYNWQKHPVIHLSLTEIDSGSVESFKTTLHDVLDEIATNYDLQLNVNLPPGRKFSNLITGLHKKFGQKAVILIDEYDKPLINNITNRELAVRFREELKSLYTVLKDNDSHIRFLFLTGVSKFSKVSVFSGLNNLNDISFSDKYASICGYTQEELEAYFEPYFEGVKSEIPKGYDTLEIIRKWYNGYRFTESEIRVYNPFSVLQLFWHKKIKDYWFQTGTPTFLIDLIKEKGAYNFYKLPEEELSESDFNAYEVDTLEVLPLLFQTGYLTIKDAYKSMVNWVYKLGFPNQEVRYSFNESLLKSLSSEGTGFSNYGRKIAKAINDKDYQALFDLLKSYLANFPYNVQVSAERYYQSIMYAVFLMIYDNVSLEEPCSVGRSDMVIELKDKVYVMEFKLNQNADRAMEQIKEKKYYEKHQASSKEIILIGMNFNTDIHNIDEWKVEEL